MDSVDSLLIFIAAVASIAAWLNARGTKRMARQRLDKVELQLGSLQRVVEEQRKSLRALEEQAAALVSTSQTISTPGLGTSLGTSQTISAAALAGTSQTISGTSVGTSQTISTPVDAATSQTIFPPASDAAPIEALAAPPLAELLPDPAPAQAARVAAAPESTSLEEKIALVWFTRIGALALLVGVAFFFKYAVDNDWIGPLGRVLLGALTGAAILATAEAIRARTKAAFLQVLLGVGLSFLFVTAYASHALYHLLPMPAAFAAIGVVTLLGGALSVRHRGEGVLVLSLLAGFACPVLLSTGRDLPGPLFAYLLVLTGLGFATSVRMGFRYATWLGIAGSTALFIGWYGKFFEVNPPTESLNEDGEKMVFEGGAYFAMAARAIPLAAVAAFLGEWLAVQRFARRSPHAALLQPVALLVTALLLAHAGFSALLFDRSLILGLVLAGLAAISTILLGAEERRELLGLPLVASFLVLLGCAHAAQTEPGGMLAVLGLLGAVYAGGILRGQIGGALKPDARTVLLLCGVGLGVALVSGALLLELHPSTFAFVLAALSLAYAAFALVAGAPAVAAGAAALSFAGLMIAEPRGSGTASAPFLAAAALWAAIYFASGAWELLARRAPPTPARLFTLSGAGLGFAALLMVDTTAESWLLRSLVLGLVGALDLAVGATLLQRGSRQAATVLLGQALGLFAGAAAVIFSGATVTIIWAALAAVAAVLAAAEGDPQWLAGAGLLFALAILRALAVDFEVPEQERERFFYSLGRAGALRETFLLNTRALALLGTAAALLVSARALARRAARGFAESAFAGATVGHLLLVVLCVCEARNLYLSTPAPPGLPLDDSGAFRSLFHDALLAQQEALSVVTTVVMSLYAALLVGIGFGARSKTHRFLGLGLFAVTLAKLVLWDVWHLPRLQQMVVLLAMGALLLGSSFLYARFGKRLVTLLRDGELHAPKPGTTALLLLLGAGLAAGGAAALEPGKFEKNRAIEGVSAPGLYRVELDPPLYGATLADLGDLRIAGPGGDETPYLVRDLPARRTLVRHEATVVDPVTLPGGATRAVLDLGQTGLKHSQVELEIDGSDFLRRTRIESSADEVSFARLAEGALVYRVESGDAQSAGLSIRYPLSDARYLRVTLLPGADGQALRIRAARLSEVTEETTTPERTLDVVAHDDPNVAPGQPRLWVAPTPPGIKATWLQLDLGQAGVPFDALRLEIATPLFERRVSIKASDDQRHWSWIGGGLLYRAAGAEGLTLHFSPTRARVLRVEISDGDNPRLELRAAHASYRPQELVFSAAAAGPHTLFVGAPTIGSPAYDLGAILARSGEALPIAPARFAPLGDNPAFHPPAPPLPPTPPLSERYKTLILSLLGLVLLALALWTLRLMRSPGGPGAPPA